MPHTQEAVWTPDWAVHPGELLEEYLDANQLTQAEFARRADISAKHVSTIISGDASVSVETARAFERVLGVSAHIWTRAQDEWDLHRSKLAEHAFAVTEEAKAWVSAFPVKELKLRGVIPAETSSPTKIFGALLSFFGVASIEGYNNRFNRLKVQYRHSPTKRSEDACLRSWLQLGEIAARSRKVVPFKAEVFNDVLGRCRALTTERPETFFPKLVADCASAGVTVVAIKPLPNTRLSGAAWWIGPEHAIIQLSLRHKSNDHFWFSFFHEAGHVLLHKRDVVFADDQGGTQDGLEDEADRFAEDKLVGRERLAQFMEHNPIVTEGAVVTLAEKAGIHPGIVVGMLQHHGKLAWSKLNHLKDRFEFKD